MQSSDFVQHEACPKCGSENNLARYSDGHAHCFSAGCDYREKSGGTVHESTPYTKSVQRKTMDKPLITDGTHSALAKRGISLDTCEKWNYQIGKFKDRPVQIANYYDGNEIVAQKVRFPDKDFTVRGDGKALAGLLYGQHLWRDGGRMVVVTEGEVDALSVSQIQGNKWAVVSIPNGAQGAAKSVRAQLEWLEKFESVIFMFDMDEPGREAAEECAQLLTPGKAKIATLPLKDANEMLVAGRAKEVIDAIWGAKVYRPDGILSGDDMTVVDLMETSVKGFDSPYPKLNEMLGGVRKGELTLFTAGTGVGKSTVVREIGAHFIKAGLRVGNIFLEESYKKTAQAYVAIDQNVHLGDLRQDPKILDASKWEDSMRLMIQNGRTFFYNHFGSLESDNLLAKLHYFATGLEVDFILLDHISIVVSGMESSREGERKDIDLLMTKLRQLIEQTGVGVIAIAHLAKTSGTPHEEGGRVTLNDLRGSGTLKQIPDNIVAVERDQQGEDPNVSTLRVLKNREFSELGVADELRYNRDTGRLLPVENDPFAEATPVDTKEDF
jgi:twinkle protein